MELIEDNHEGLVSYWISKEPKTKYEIGLKALIDFNIEEIELIEEGVEGRTIGSISMYFEEFKNLRTIIEERKQSEKENKKA